MIRLVASAVAVLVLALVQLAGTPRAASSLVDGCVLAGLLTGAVVVLIAPVGRGALARTGAGTDPSGIGLAPGGGSAATDRRPRR